MNFASVLLKTQVEALNHGGYLCKFRTGIFALLLQHDKDFKNIAGEAYIITVPFL